MFFSVLKVGLAGGNPAWRHQELQTALALYMVIAWCINRLMRLGAPCRFAKRTCC
jgi:hypothetical protein